MMHGIATLPVKYRRAFQVFYYRNVRFEGRDHSSWWYARQKRHRLSGPHQGTCYWWFNENAYPELGDVKRAIDAFLGGPLVAE